MLAWIIPVVAAIPLSPPASPGELNPLVEDIPAVSVSDDGTLSVCQNLVYGPFGCVNVYDLKQPTEQDFRESCFAHGNEHLAIGCTGTNYTVALNYLKQGYEELVEYDFTKQQWVVKFGATPPEERYCCPTIEGTDGGSGGSTSLPSLKNGFGCGDGRPAFRVNCAYWMFPNDLDPTQPDGMGGANAAGFGYFEANPSVLDPPGWMYSRPSYELGTNLCGFPIATQLLVDENGDRIQEGGIGTKDGCTLIYGTKSYRRDPSLGTLTFIPVNERKTPTQYLDENLPSGYTSTDLRIVTSNVEFLRTLPSVADVAVAAAKKKRSERPQTVESYVLV